MKIIGDGSVTVDEPGKQRKQCRKWKLRINTDEGPRVRRFNGTYTQAKAELTHFMAELLSASRDASTFSEVAQLWLSRRRRAAEVDPDTLIKDACQIRKLERYFGSSPVADLTPSDIQDGLLQMKLDDGLGNTYLNSLYHKMKAVLKEAVRDGRVDKNPMDDLKPPKVDECDRRALSELELTRFFSALDMLPMDSHTIAARIAVLGGLRRGEIVYLRWEDVDFETNEIRVFGSVSENVGAKDKTKTKAGMRYVPMVRPLAELLKKWQRIQDRQLAENGIKQTLATLVTPSETNTHLHPQNLDRWWRKHRKGFGLDGIVLHELRHTYLTMAAANGASFIDLKGLAGWSDVTMANRYVHVSRESLHRAVDTMSDMLDGII